MLVEFYDEESRNIIEGEEDTLALFIVRDRMTTFQQGVKDGAQNSEAIRAMTVAKKELESVIKALERRLLQIKQCLRFSAPVVPK